jgi:hypothetical protein
MSFLRRYGANAKNLAQWSAHVVAFAPEPELTATWRCPVCKRRRPTTVKRCCR